MTLFEFRPSGERLPKSINSACDYTYGHKKNSNPELQYGYQDDQAYADQAEPDKEMKNSIHFSD